MVIPQTLSSMKNRRDHQLFFHDAMVPIGQLLEASMSLSAAITRLSKQQPARIGVLAGNTPAFICALFSVLALRTSAVLISPTLRSRELAQVLRDSGVALLVTADDREDAPVDLGNKARLEMQAAIMPGKTLKLWRLDTGNGGRESRDPDPDEFVCQLTSGVTGASQIVSRSYANVENEIKNYINTLDITKNDTILCPAPLFHAYGLFNGLVPSLCSGARFVLMQKFYPTEIANLTELFRPTILVGVPFMYEMLNRMHLEKPLDLSSYRLLLSAGANLRQNVIDKFDVRFGTTITQIYGSTETGIVTVNLPGGAGYDARACGQPLPDRRIKIVDDHGVSLPSGQEGIVVIASPGTTRGYINRDVLNAEKFRDGWYFTGDLGFFNEYGALYIIGRKDGVINVEGLKVDPSEVETALNAHDGVKDCAVVGLLRKDGRNIVCAYVIAENANISAAVLKDYCSANLSPHKVPREFRFLDTLPRSHTGKILRKYLVSDNFFSQRGGSLNA